MNDAPSRLLRFGDFELDLEREVLRRSGIAVKAHAQPLRLLALLARRPGQLVTREEIRRHLWPPGTHVDFEQGINACVKQMRATLGDNADAPTYVRTVPRRGYCFVAPVEETPRRERSRTSSGRIYAGAALLAAALLLGLHFVGAPAPDATRPSLAVLPFQTLSPDPDQSYLGDAITEELITHLGGTFTDRISVIARTSIMRYAESDKDVSEIARELGVRYLVEGSIQPVDGRFRVTAQLIRASDRSHLWAQTYDRSFEDLLAMQTEIGEKIAGTLASKLLPDTRLAVAPAPGAYEAYLRGRYLASKRTRESLQAAVKAYEEAVALDPGFARAHAALGQAYARGARREDRVPVALRQIRRALELDPDLAEAHLTLALLQFYGEFDFEGARRSFERALELNPQLSNAHHSIAAYYSVTGRHDEALAAVRRARQLDPVSADVNADIGWYHYFARDYDTAITASKRTLELEPGFFWARLCIELASLKRGTLEDAVPVVRATLEANDAFSDELAALEDDPERFMQAYWTEFISRMQEYAERGHVAPSDLAHVYMALGRQDAALEALEGSYAQRSGWILPFLSVDPLFDPLRGDPRFQALLARIHAPVQKVARR